MNWKTWVPLVLAIVLGVVAAKVARDTILKNKGGDANAAKFTKVVVAKADISPGKELTAEDLVLSQVQNDAVPEKSFKTVEEIVGRATEMQLIKGVPVIESMLAQTGSGSGLAALVPTGMRAVTVEVNEFTGLAGLITPGCRVDVVSTINDDGQQTACTIVQNIQVKAVGQRTTMNSNEPPNPNEMFRSVTLITTPEDAQAIELACATSRPRLVLRGGLDKEIVASTGITLAKLRGNDDGNVDPFTMLSQLTPPTSQPVASTQPSEATEAVAIAEPPKRVVRLIKGGHESTVTLDVLDGTPASAIGNTSDPSDEAGDPFGK